MVVDFEIDGVLLLDLVREGVTLGDVVKLTLGEDVGVRVFEGVKPLLGEAVIEREGDRDREDETVCSVSVRSESHKTRHTITDNAFNPET